MLACTNGRLGEEGSKGSREGRRAKARELEKENQVNTSCGRLAESRALRQLALGGRRAEGNIPGFSGPQRVPVLCVGSGEAQQFTPVRERRVIGRRYIWFQKQVLILHKFAYLPLNSEGKQPKLLNP